VRWTCCGVSSAARNIRRAWNAWQARGDEELRSALERFERWLNEALATAVRGLSMPWPTVPASTLDCPRFVGSAAAVPATARGRAGLLVPPGTDA
jgi:hypothetical protein